MSEATSPGHALVTGVAGFIGSTLASALLADGWSVCGIDCFTPYYDEASKRSNLESLLDREGFEFRNVDLCLDPLDDLVAGARVVFHLAGQPGVRLSWSEGFERYLALNVGATQRLLEAAAHHGQARVVYASSSSVYGNTRTVPTSETQLPQPYSPYGVTKLAGEHLCTAYAENYGIEVAILRFFTVYGPRQRPDMAIHRLIEAGLSGSRFAMFGDGSQIRDFTYVDDVVTAVMAAATVDAAVGRIINVAGGGATSMRDLVDIVGDTIGHPVDLDHRPAQSGDVQMTGGSIDLARSLLAWAPAVELLEGVRRQVEWHRWRWNRLR